MTHITNKMRRHLTTKTSLFLVFFAIASTTLLTAAEEIPKPEAVIVASSGNLTNQTNSAVVTTTVAAIVNATTTNLTNSTTNSTLTTIKPTTAASTHKLCAACNHNGVCKESSPTVCSGQCLADFFGSACEFTKCPAEKENGVVQLATKQCRNAGICRMHFKTKQISCACPNKQYTGALCEKPLCLDYCYNNGKCSHSTDSSNSTNVSGDMKCDCGERFSGERCQFDKCAGQVSSCPVDCFLDGGCKCQCKADCDKAYCNQGSGTCVADIHGVSGAVGMGGKPACNCNVGYSGATCTIDECKGRCFNGGHCQKNATTVSCTCLPEFGGPRCSSRINKSDSSSSQTNSTTVDDNASHQEKKEGTTGHHIMFGLSVTIVLCLLSFGVYFALSHGYVRTFIEFAENAIGRSSTDGGVRHHTPFVFNKLEDEQGIVHNEL